MIFEPEFLILAMLVSFATATAWWMAHGQSFSLADLTIVEPRPKSGNSKSAQKPGHIPVLLRSALVAATIESKAAPAQPLPSNPGETPLDTQSQLNRVSNILNNAIDIAAKAERLHNAAHEQLDSAHYALQNLLDELSAVMPIASPAKSAVQAQAKPFPAERPVYHTALAA